MGIDDYLAKHYGPASKKERKSKKKKNGDAPVHGGVMSVVIDDDDDDRVYRTKPSDLGPELAAKGVKAGPAFKDPKSSWQIVSHANKTDEIEGLLDPAEEEEERPVVAEGADLLKEYSDKKKREAREKREEEEEERRRRRRAEKQRLEQLQQKEEKEQENAAESTERPPEMRYGLQTAEVFKEDADRERAYNMRKLEQAAADASAQEEQTVYRDAKTGK
ncbi:hypothetical protein LPJ59_002695, partial [Coemansia sp. RSA 2399]